MHGWRRSHIEFASVSLLMNAAGSPAGSGLLVIMGGDEFRPAVDIRPAMRSDLHVPLCPFQLPARVGTHLAHYHRPHRLRFLPVNLLQCCSGGWPSGCHRLHCQRCPGVRCLLCADDYYSYLESPHIKSSATGTASHQIPPRPAVQSIGDFNSI